MVKKHPDVKIKGKTVDMSDLESDPIVVWQRR
jgi:stearoyl-CoA desaturase (delta-9 desaturase)